MRPSLMKLTRSAPPVSMLDQVPATVVCTGWFAPASARKNAAVITTPVLARIDRNEVLVRRGCPHRAASFPQGFVEVRGAENSPPYLKPTAVGSGRGESELRLAMSLLSPALSSRRGGEGEETTAKR